MGKKGKKVQKPHYAWAILLACCLIQGAGLGIVNNCVGLFYVPVCEDLGFSRGNLTLYVTFQNMCCCFGMLCSQKILRKIPLQYVLAIASLLAGIPYFLLSRATRLWHWYVLGSLQGLGTAFITSLVVPIVLRQWFRRRLGMAMGVASSFAGFTGAVMSAILGVVIRNLSWRTGYALSGILLLAMTLPASLLVIRMTPGEKGLRPYGAAAEEKIPTPQKTGLYPTARDIGKAQLLQIMLLGFMAKVFCSFVSHLPAYGISVSISIVDASLLTTFCMLGNMTTKLAFGLLNDRVGAKKASNIAFCMIGGAILLLMSKVQIAMCVGAFLFGTVSMFSITQVPLIARTICDEEQYANILVAVNVASYISYSVSMSLYGYLYDWLGSYDMILLMLLGGLIVEFFQVHFLIQKKAAA